MDGLHDNPFPLWDALDLEIPRNQRQVLQKVNPLDFFSDRGVLRRYRLSKNTARELIELVGPAMETHTLPACIRVLSALRILTGGCYQVLSGDIVRVSQPTCSRSLRAFLGALLVHRRRFVCFPPNLRAIKGQFMRIARFPSVIGAIDGTSITSGPIDGPVASVPTDGPAASGSVESPTSITMKLTLE